MIGISISRLLDENPLSLSGLEMIVYALAYMIWANPDSKHFICIHLSCQIGQVFHTLTETSDQQFGSKIIWFPCTEDVLCVGSRTVHVNDGLGAKLVKLNWALFIRLD